MQVYINKQLAALKKDISFDYVSENRLFSGSDGYTLSITFPLRDCPQNLAIFGHINRADVVAGKVIFGCEMRDKNFSKFGSITIIEISESEVTAQFLEGRSEQNFNDTFDTKYINELDLGNPSGANDSTPVNAWNPELNNMKCVALPWVNNTSGNIQNLADYIVDDPSQNKGHYRWNKDCRGRSWQPYLLYITKKICEEVGYSFDFSKWEEREEYKYLLICNTLPYAWETDNFARALPAWTVAEYFEKLELFLGGEFTIDHRRGSIVFDFTEDVLSGTPEVYLGNVVDEHTAQISSDSDKCEYRELKNIVFKECDHEMWKFYSCDWFIKAQKEEAVRYNTLSELLEDNKEFSTWNGANVRGSRRNKLLYAADVDAYFIIRSLHKTLVKKYNDRANDYSYTMELRPVNLFGGRIVDPREDADQIELEFVPAWVDETEEKYGSLLFQSIPGYNEPDANAPESSNVTSFEEWKKEYDETLFQPMMLNQLTAGAETKTAEYFDRIYIGWWNGEMSSSGKLPHPYVEDIEIAPDWSNYRNIHFSIRLNRTSKKHRQIVHQINPKIKKTFKFLSDTLPDSRAVFFIKGGKYICEKITATFTDKGMSQLMKGEFYLIDD